MMMMSNFTSLLALLITALVSSTAATGESSGLRNFELSATPLRKVSCATPDDCASHHRCQSGDNPANQCDCVNIDETDGIGRCMVLCEEVEDCAVVTKCQTEDGENQCYCAKAVGDCGGKGECKVVELWSDKSSRFVCGCDGTTYFNASEAAKYGINVESRRPCAVTPRSSDVAAVE
mmetsp:Transcript_12815/g.19325  ORF Transcript_12815/g.19325 Transcript_12815/m.19325 type:complete len:177 (-) Transcript_12815:103-633(-)|eukprot:scaffold9463_cov136-Skeletonema_dohrnii-CCMP3373.AAC.3